ncbi:MAG: magnesium transporter CorA family protein [Mesorhizobium sp.]
MLRSFVVDKDLLRPVDSLSSAPDDVVWVDVLNPTPEEEGQVEAWLGVDIPTREDMEEIEISSRLYVENGTYFMTATLPSQTDTDKPVMSPVSFVLSGHRLVTVRYHEPQVFKGFPLRAEKVPLGCTSGETILITLLEAIVDRLADVLERVAHEVLDVSQAVFHPAQHNASQRGRDFQLILRKIGRKEELISNMHDSLVTLQRLAGFFGNATLREDKASGLRGRIKTLSRDVASLSDYASFLSQKVTFLLDATLGMINIEQNGIIKIFSVAAVVFLPPTLVASIYGMNFEVMPELRWILGYPFALVLMVISAVLPFLYFKRRGWL